MILHTFMIPTPLGAPRYTRTVSIPAGAEVWGVMSYNGDAAHLIVRGDPQATPVDTMFSLVREDVPLQAAEQTARIIGWVRGYVQADGTVPTYFLLGP